MSDNQVQTETAGEQVKVFASRFIADIYIHIRLYIISTKSFNYEIVYII